MLGACQPYHKICISGQDKDMSMFLSAKRDYNDKCLLARPGLTGATFPGMQKWIDNTVVVYYINLHGAQNQK